MFSTPANPFLCPNTEAGCQLSLIQAFVGSVQGLGSNKNRKQQGKGIIFLSVWEAKKCPCTETLSASVTHPRDWPGPWGDLYFLSLLLLLLLLSCFSRVRLCATP